MVCLKNIYDNESQNLCAQKHSNKYLHNLFEHFDKQNLRQRHH